MLTKNIKKATCIFLCILCTIAIVPILSTYAADDNIVLNMDYIISSDADITGAFPTFVENDSAKKLTDGKTAASNILSDPNWLKLYRGVTRYIDFDFGKDVLVSGFSVNFCNVIGGGVYPSRKIKMEISTDGVNYYTLHDINKNLLYNPPEGIVTIREKSDQYYKARYVRISLSSDVHLYIDEVEIYGANVGDKTDTAYTATPRKEVPDKFPEINNAKISSDIILMYNSEYYSDVVNDIGKNTYDEMKPYAAYVDSKGNPTDTFFDIFLFLPLNNNKKDDLKFNNQAYMQGYINNTIGKSEDINLTALNKLVDDLKNKLSIPEDYKLKIIMSVPFVEPSSKTFGTLDGSKPITPNTRENRYKIIKWIINTSKAQFEAEKFENLELVGFYWYQELINYTLSDYEEELVKDFNTYVHSLGLETLWIPYYCAPGTDIVEELGFDVVTLQSGYAFPGEKKPTEKNVYDAMYYARKYGMGVEFESGSESDNAERFNTYLHTAASLGAMDYIAAYYQGGGPGTFKIWSSSTNSSLRKLYDDVYKYVKKEYKLVAPSMNIIDELLVGKNSGVNTAYFTITDPDTVKSKIKIEITEQPKNGELSIKTSGIVSYRPNEDFKGEDSFKFVLNDGYNKSPEYAVKVIVSDKVKPINNFYGSISDNQIAFTDEKYNLPSEDIQAYTWILNSDYKVLSEQKDIPEWEEGKAVIIATGDKIQELKNSMKIGEYIKIDKYFKNILIDGETQSVVSGSEVENNNGPNTYVLVIIIAAVVIILGLTAVIIIKKLKKGEKQK
ncbi:DUF4855 domain-containing protein [Eubacteriales bacterium OttesenSCG-928-G02]|nr:DUF4855 domain-containing protein [Eubacteriales bacterium OttesenSCG-928-G02]